MRVLPALHFTLALTALFMHVTSHADCENYLTAATTEEKHLSNPKIARIEKRLLNLSDSEQFIASALLRALANDGSPVDIEVFEAFLDFRLKLPQRPINRPMEHATRSPYIQATEDWPSLLGYFFNSPSALTVTRVEDLNFLRHLIGATERMPLHDAVQQWHLTRLSRFPNVLKSLEKWQSQRSFDQLKRNLVKKLLRVTGAREHFWIEYLSSPFDLFLVDQYLEQILRFRVSQYDASKAMEPSLQINDWRNFSSNLKLGSISYVGEFTAASSHDTELKAYLLAILLKMKMQAREVKPFNFAEAFELARWHVDRELIDIPPPEQYQSNMSVFTLAGQRDPLQKGNPFIKPVAAEIQVQWNSKLGRLQASLAEALPMKSQLRVKDNIRLVEFLRNYFDFFENGEEYKHDEIKKHFEYDLASSLVRNTFVIFTRPGFPQEAVAMVKLFNGHKIDFADGQLQQAANDIDQSRTSIEHLFPHLVFEERLKGEGVREIGRMLAVAEHTEPRSLSILMARVADFLYRSGARGSAYFYGVKKVRKHHVRLGAEVVFEPEDLALPKGSEPKWVMRMPVEKMAERFFSRIFEAVHLKQPPPRYLVDGPTPEMVYAHAQFAGPPGFHAEAALLHQEDSQLSLLITHREGDDIRHQSIVDNPNLGIFWSGMAGTEPSLEVENGNLVLHQQNESIGRNRWQRKLTIGFIDGEYIVTNFSYRQRDTLILGQEEDCEYDLIRGTGFRNGAPVQIAKTRLKLEGLHDHEALHSCLGW